MSHTSRRKFLESTAIASVGALAGAAASPKLSAFDASDQLTGTLVGVGFGAKRMSTQPSIGTSIITELKLSRGDIRSAFVPMPAAHTLMMTKTGFSLCLPLDGTIAAWVDSHLATVGTIEAPNGFLFSGHGVVAAEGLHAYVTLRRKDAQSFSDTGRIGVVDLRSRKILGTFDSGGVRPHDIAAAGKTLVVSHYGDINYEKTGKTAANRREPKLVTLDAGTGRILQVINTPAEGSLTHFALGDAAKVCAVPLNYYGFDENGRRAVERTLAGKSFEISVAEELEGRIASPMPILMLDCKNGAVKELRGDPIKQRRAQSVAYHPRSGRFFVTYSFSDTVACIDEQGVHYISGFDLGLSFVRGVCALGNTGLVAVTGEFRGVALVDAQQLTVVKRLDVPWYDNAHVAYRA